MPTPDYKELDLTVDATLDELDEVLVEDLHLRTPC